MAAPSSSSIRAGGAFVELWVKSNMFTRGLDAAAARLNRFGSAMRGFGLRTAAMGGIILAPFIAAAKAFVDYASEVVDASDRLGTTTDDLTSLKFAAEQSGASFETLTKALGKFNLTMAGAKSGSKGTLDAFKKLGLTVEDLDGKSFSEQLELIAGGFEDVDDRAEKAAIANQLFGKAGRDLIPLLNEGAEGLQKFREEAEAAGLVLGDDGARKAEAFGDSLAKLQAVAHMAFINFGSAILPVIESLSRWMQQINRGAVAVSGFIAANRGIIIAGAQVIGVMIGLSLAVVALSYVFSGLAAILGVVKIAFVALGAVIGFLTTPLGLVVGVLATLAVLWLTLTEEGRTFANSVATACEEMAARVMTSWGGIKDAMGAASPLLAATIAFHTFKGEALRVMKQLQLAWTDMVDFFGDGFDSAANLMTHGWNAFGDFFMDLGRDMTLAVVNMFLDAFKVIFDASKPLRKVLEKAGVTIEDPTSIKDRITSAMTEDKKKTEAERMKRDRGIDDVHTAAKAAREAARGAIADSWDEDIAAVDEKVRELIAKAAEDKAAFDADKGPEKKKKKIKDGLDLAASAKGTFSGAALGQSLGASDKLSQKLLDSNKAQEDLLKEIRDKLDDGGLEA
jgi:hypothetical protein